MGLGADTIRFFAEEPYRRAEEMRLKDENRIKAIVELHRLGVRDSTLSWVAYDCASLDTFEAVARGAITAEEGGWLLGLQRMRRPWYIRLAVWTWNVLLPGEERSKP